MFTIWLIFAIPALLYGSLMVYTARVAREPVLYGSEKTQIAVLYTLSGFFFVPAAIMLFAVLLIYVIALMNSTLMDGDSLAAIIGLGIPAILVGLLGFRIVGCALALKRDPQRRAGKRMVFFQVFGWCLIISAFPPTLAIFIAYVIFVALQQRRAERSMLLWHLALAIEKEMPLSEELSSVATSFSSSMRRQILMLVRSLNQGKSFSHALRQVPTIFPADVRVAVEVAADNGNLPEVLKHFAMHYSHPPSWIKMGIFSPSMLINYILFIPLIGFNILFFIMWWIIPKFKKIFEDFGTELPSLTKTLIACSDFIVDFFYVIPCFMLLTLMLVTGYYFFRVHFKLWDLSRIPIFRWWLKKNSLPGVLRVLSSSTAGEQPLSQPFRVLAGEHPRIAIRRAAAQVALGVEAGKNAWELMQYEGLLNRKQTALLASAERAGNLRWALNELAESLENRQAFRLITAFSFVEPAIVLFVGAITGFVVIALFFPLVKLISDFS